MEANSKFELKKMLSFGSFYPVGASVLYAISMLDHDKIKDYNSKTPYQMASELLNLSPAEKASALERAKLSEDWAAIQKKASDLTN